MAPEPPFANDRAYAAAHHRPPPNARDSRLGAVADAARDRLTDTRPQVDLLPRRTPVTPTISACREAPVRIDRRSGFLSQNGGLAVSRLQVRREAPAAGSHGKRHSAPAVPHVRLGHCDRPGRPSRHDRVRGEAITAASGGARVLAVASDRLNVLKWSPAAGLMGAREPSSRASAFGANRE